MAPCIAFVSALHSHFISDFKFIWSEHQGRDITCRNARPVHENWYCGKITLYLCSNIPASPAYGVCIYRSLFIMQELARHTISSKFEAVY
jgi:hypothetical protein